MNKAIIAQRFQSENQCDYTNAERIFKNKLHDLGVNFTTEKPFYNDNFLCLCDFFIRRGVMPGIAIEIDGPYHLSPDQAKRDTYKSDWLRHNHGVVTIRFTNEEVINNIDFCIQTLAKHFLTIEFRKKGYHYRLFTKINKE